MVNLTFHLGYIFQIYIRDKTIVNFEYDSVVVGIIAPNFFFSKTLSSLWKDNIQCWLLLPDIL